MVLHLQPGRSRLSTVNNVKESDALVNHPFIPKDEIQVKIGGDHGGGSFKISYQIANAMHPNKLENTVIFSIFTKKDSRANLRICLERFKTHITKLNEVKWCDKQFRVFMFGDLFCTTNSSDMQLPKGTVGVQHEPRTLEHFKENFRKFETDYGIDLKHAMQYYNAIDVLFFDIPLNEVCLPGLHITLGICMKMFRDIIERFCETMDTVILEHQISQQGTPGYYGSKEAPVNMIID